MTDAELVAKKLAEIETYVRDLVRLARPDKLEADVKEQRFVLMTLQLAVQAALDVASHIVSDERLGEPERNRDLFRLMSAAGWLTESVGIELERMAGFRNIVVHEYVRVDLDVVRDVLAHRLEDLLRFAESVRKRLPPP